MQIYFLSVVEPLPYITHVLPILCFRPRSDTVCALSSGAVLVPVSILPDPINHLCSLSDGQISGNYLIHRSVQIFKSCVEGQMLQGLILRHSTRLCGTGFVTQHGGVVHFCLTTMVRRQ